MRMLDARGDYFDQRSGYTWDLFFPGYYKSTKDPHFERQTGARRLRGIDYTADWYFNAREFDTMRRHVEKSSEQRWKYSGSADLVLVNGYSPERGEPTIDWASTVSGQVSDQAAGIWSLTLGNVIERITIDLESGTEDPAYGVGAVTDDTPPEPAVGNLTRDIMVNALGGIAAALGARFLGV